MATVYIGRARRDDGSEERVALKVIRDELADDEQFKHMFVDEAKILSRLSHPSVIQTLEHGVTGHHRFIAMELLSGRTYSDVWDLLVANGETMPVALGAWICARVAEGLHSAHELVDDAGVPLGVIHRDVNPSNIFLTHGGDVKLIDFGLAKARVRLSKSADGIVKGKIPYLAPEQAHGRPIDRRIDVYALGATLWESATMQRLFKRSTDVDTLRAIRDAVVPDVRTLVPDFPDELWQIIERALRVNRDERFETAEGLREALDLFVGERSVEMKSELSFLLTRLFPGQEARQSKWERDATSVRLPAHTMRPPAPIPTASSSMLEDESLPNEPEPPAARGTANAKTPNTTKKPKRKRAWRLKGKRKNRAAPASAPRDARAKLPTPDDSTTHRRSGDPNAPHRMWVSLLVAIAIVVALALAFSAR